jgi:hypothetical protein
LNIDIKLTGISETIEALQSIPGAAGKALQLAIRRSLKSGRDIIVKEATAHYMVPGWYVRKQVGEPRISGLTGVLETRGSHIPLYLFPHADQYPGGVSVEEIRGHPMQLLHAFTKGYTGAGKVLQRLHNRPSHGWPLVSMVGLSLPEMISENDKGNDVVGRKVEERVEERVGIELDSVIAALLSGAVRFEGGRLRRSI